MVVVAACSSAAPAPSGGSAGLGPSSVASATTLPSSGVTVPTGPPTEIAPQVMPQHGMFTGRLTNATEAYPVVIWMDGCVHTREVCGDLELADPAHPEFTLCAPQLVFDGRDGDRDVFTENPAYRADACSLATVRIGAVASSSPLVIDVEVSSDDGSVPTLRGTLTQTSDQPPSDPPPPELPAIDGLKGPSITVDLGGPTTPYAAADATSAYFPVQGEVISISLKTGQTDEIASNRDVASTVDPKAVTTSGDAVWVTRVPSKTLERIDPSLVAAATPLIALPHAPYALAADGATLWVTSLEDSIVMAVDTSTGRVKATVQVPSPTAVAVGGGSVWVVEHADGKLARIDPVAARVTAEVPIGKGGLDPDCSMCAETVVYAFDSAWTADGVGRSITRVDHRSLKATTYPTANRVWSVAAYGGYVYGSQFEEVDGYIDRHTGGLVRIDPRTNRAEQLSAPGVLGVAALGDALWLIVPARRSDVVLSYTSADR